MERKNEEEDFGFYISWAILSLDIQNTKQNFQKICSVSNI